MAQQLPQIHSVHSSQRRPAHGSARPAAPSLLSRVPWGFLAVIAVLVAYGLVVCWSAVQGDADYNFTRQLQGVAVGLVAMVALWAFDYRRLSNLTTALLVINVVLILLPHIPGLGTDAGMGAKSWIKIGMQVQPGEFAKVTVVLFAASLLARYQGTLDDWREYCKVLGMLLVPFAAIMTQPDLGTGLVYLAISAVVLVMGGAKGRYLLITLIAGIAAIAAVFAVDELLKYQQSDGTWEYRLLKNYQRSRLLVFLNPEGDLSGDGYNLAQAKIAIGCVYPKEEETFMDVKGRCLLTGLPKTITVTSIATALILGIITYAVMNKIEKSKLGEGEEEASVPSAAVEASVQPVLNETPADETDITPEASEEPAAETASTEETETPDKEE